MNQFIISILIIVMAGCTLAPQPKTKNIDFSLASKSFNSEFPRVWPAKKIITPSAEQKSIIKNMTTASSYKLSKMGVKHVRTSDYIIKILPGNSTYLNKQAKRLKKLKSTLLLDSLYFAKNPFSAGTFDSTQKVMILSHENLTNENRMKLVLQHEFVHVETYQKLISKTPSVFHCNFKGPQFEPHYLSCDEMNAYHQDLKTLVKNKADKKDIKNKLQPAKGHTSPIPKLISSLNTKSISFDHDIVTIKGTNKGGPYRIEFPAFNLTGKANSQNALKHLDQIKATAVNLEKQLGKLSKNL